MYKMHTVCRVCGYGSAIVPERIKSDKPPDKLIPVFDLGLQPLANSFAKADEEQQGSAPLQVLRCPKCNLAQLSIVVRPDILYDYYCYHTSPSQTMLAHFEKLAGMLRTETGRSDFGRVLEIGSNDGRFLKHLKSEGALEVRGIDPAGRLVAEANHDGIWSYWGTLERYIEYIEIHQTPLNERTQNIGDCVANSGRADVVIARHVLCHIDDWRGFIKDLERVTHKDSLVCIEVPWVQKTLDNLEFDTIYHEHLSYFSINAMTELLRNSAFEIVKIIQFDIHGGALMVLLRRREARYKQDGSVADLWFSEHCGESEWRKFSRGSWLSIGQLQARVGDLRAEGKTVAAYGASAKSTVLMNACKFTNQQIAWIADCTPEKQWRFSPGTDIPIVDEGALLRELPDYCLMTCWNFEREVLDKNALYLSNGGHFIIPVPEFRIV